MTKLEFEIMMGLKPKPEPTTTTDLEKVTYTRLKDGTWGLKGNIAEDQYHRAL